MNQPKGIDIIFRASQYNFNATYFHEICDGRNDTLVILRNDYGKTIGGFTHYPWKAHQTGEAVCDSGRKSFLFSLDTMEKYVPQSDNDLIFCHAKYGPTFGKGNDLYIADSCWGSNLSYTNFPSTYNREGETKWELN